MQENKGKEKSEGKNENAPIRVGITVGDINGIGPEVIIKALRNSEILVDCTPIIYASSKLMSFHKKLIEDELFVFQGVSDASQAQDKKINIVQSWTDIADIQIGKATEIGGRYAFYSLEKATQDLASGKIDVLVTAPISKETIHMAGFMFPGHTEYLADLSGQKEALMMMVSGDLRVALVTSHIPLKDVIAEVKQDKVFAKISELNKSLKKDFGIVRPRIAVLGLNPHAGEKGAMGTEESEQISPAIQKAMGEGILAFGPYPSDGFFGSREYTKFDGVLAMYHDQGLTGFKSLAFDDGVNFTASLPIVRTSPDHGTAFNIAGKNEANEQSMRSAIYLALDVYRTRKWIKSITENPLKPQTS